MKHAMRTTNTEHYDLNGRIASLQTWFGTFNRTKCMANREEMYFRFAVTVTRHLLLQRSTSPLFCLILPLHSSDMPKKRSKKVKAKPVAPAKDDQEMQVDEAGPSTPTLPRKEISEKPELDNQPEKDINLESDPVDNRIEKEDVEESVGESMTGVEEDVRSKTTSGQPEESQPLETKKMSMEERKIKFNELRKKMVGMVHMTV